MSTIFPLKNLHKVYCAGPLFNEAERSEMTRISSALRRHGFETFVPHADGMEFAQVQPYMVSQGCDPDEIGQLLHSAIFALDTYQVMIECGCLVFNMNGRVPDEGAVAETAMAWTLGKPVVLFKEDARSAICGRDNPLIVGQTQFQTVREIDQIALALKARLAAHPVDETWQMPCPPHLEQPLSAGGRLWQELQAMGQRRDSSMIAEVVLELFGREREAVA